MSLINVVSNVVNVIYDDIFINDNVIQGKNMAFQAIWRAKYCRWCHSFKMLVNSTKVAFINDINEQI